MKKTLLTASLALAATASLFATVDRIELYNGESLIRKIWVDDVDKITYVKGADGGYSTMNVDFTSGLNYKTDISAFDRMEYVQGLPESNLTVEVTPHYNGCTYEVKTTDGEQVYFRPSGVNRSELKGVNRREWGQRLFERDREFIHYVCEQNGYDLNTYPIDRIFYTAPVKQDWFGDEIISPDTDIVLAVYTAKIEKGDVVLTSEPVVVEWKTKKLVEADVNFTFTPKLSSNSAVVEVECQDKDRPFAIAFYTEMEVEAYGLDALAFNTCRTLEQLVYNYGTGDWSTVTHTGVGSATKSNVKIGEKYIVAAFGCEYGYQDTKVKTCEIEIPYPEVVDDCTFDVTATRLSGSEMSIDVKPSKESTRWIAMICEDSKLANSSPELYVAGRIQYLTTTNTIFWATDEKYVRTGAHTLNSHDDIIDGIYLDASKTYTAMIFGIDETGERTTEMKTVPLSTKNDQKKDKVTFDVTISDFDGEGNYTHFYTVNVIPSDPNVKYVLENNMASNYYVSLNGRSDEEIMQDFIDVQGQYMTLYTGEQHKRMSIGPEWDSDKMCWTFGKNRVIIFAYDGEILSDLYLIDVDGITGEVTQLRPVAE
ncbi:MAG: hypothetical protein HFJ91_10510 [Muribaculaceae bacterium]|nr:hypothetical protein [Muribaculaceae bacterium]